VNENPLFVADSNLGACPCGAVVPPNFNPPVVGSDGLLANKFAVGFVPDAPPNFIPPAADSADLLANKLAVEFVPDAPPNENAENFEY
jgi:hypothetical protein